MATTINYFATKFERSYLTPIRGENTFKTIHKLLNKVKSNMRSVYSNLRVGNQGHLGIALSNTQYALISQTLFVILNHPVPLTTPVDTTGAITTAMWDTHTEYIHVFRKVL